MGVYVRTSRNTGIGVPFVVYLFIVLPLQLLAYTVIAAVWLAVQIAAAAAVYLVSAAVAAYKRRNSQSG